MSAARSVIIADDDPDVISLLGLQLKQWGYRSEGAANKGELFEILQSGRFSALILDLQFGEHDGIDILGQLAQQGMTLPTIFLTACGTIPRAVQAVQLGAIDFLTKPADLLNLHRILDHVVRTRSRSKRGEKLVSPADAAADSAILGDSPAVRELKQLISDVAQTDAKVFILGETGTGKELVARELHRTGSRAQGPFVPVNMAALPETLAESVMFGHKRGAFTGADIDQQGCCEAAHRGSLFLDEVGEMPMPLQAKLLRFLQGNSFQRIGSVETIVVDTRIIAATNRTPQQMLQGGKLREDLYYRLNVVPIHVPALRHRAGDARRLAQHFLSKQQSKFHDRELSISDAVFEIFDSYHWPGNIRELDGLIERLAITSRSGVIDVASLPTEMTQCVPSSASFFTGINIRRDPVTEQRIDHQAVSQPATPAPPHVPELRASERRVPEPRALMPMEQLQKGAIEQALQLTGGNVVAAAEMLGVGQATVYRKMKRYGLTLPSARARSQGETTSLGPQSD